GFGDSLAGLTNAEKARFAAGKAEFSTAEGADEGLGPVFNDVSCVACHSAGGVGGAGTRGGTRFGRSVGGVFDPLASFGGSLLQDHGIGHACAPDGVTCAEFAAEVVPAVANVVAGRLTTPLFGLGLVDTVPDATFEALAQSERA